MNTDNNDKLDARTTASLQTLGMGFSHRIYLESLTFALIERGAIDVDSLVKYCESAVDGLNESTIDDENRKLHEYVRKVVSDNISSMLEAAKNAKK